MPSDKNKLWGTMKLQSNGVRTSIIHALMHTRGTHRPPVAAGLDALVRVPDQKTGLTVLIRSDKRLVKGKLVFDIPRHRIYMGFKYDWPRMNTMPEWFTVELDKKYVVNNVTSGSQKTYTGKQLHEGLPVELRAGEERLLLVKR